MGIEVGEATEAMLDEMEWVSVGLSDVKQNIVAGQSQCGDVKQSDEYENDSMPVLYLVLLHQLFWRRVEINAIRPS